MTLSQGVAAYAAIGGLVVGLVLFVNRQAIDWTKARAGAWGTLALWAGGVLLWPLLVGMAVYEWTQPPSPAATPEKPFTVEATHLIERVDVGAVEAQAVPHDPLGAVPPLPFGHLHACWQALLAQRQPGDMLWTFAAPHEAWGITELRRGYVLVHDGTPGPYWITHWERK